MNAVIYARYSSDKQTEQSIDGQLRVCTDYAARNGITIIDKYIDRAISGTSDKRPRFQQMISDSAFSRFDCVIVYKLDRFSRNRYDSLYYKRILNKNNVKVISATEGINGDPDSLLLEAILEADAERYSRILSMNVRRGMKESATKCNSTGGTLPLGYCVGKDKKLHIDPRQAVIVRKVFSRYAKGDTVTDIINDLNASGFRNRNGKPFHKNSFSSMLKNRKYIGEYRYGDIVVPGGMPALIDAETFQKVQERLQKNKKSPAHTKATNNYLLSGKLYCGHCKELMVGESGKGKSGQMYYYYKCSNRKKGGNCKKSTVKKDFIESLTLDLLCKHVLRDDTIDYIAELVCAEQQKIHDDNSMLTSLKIQLTDVKRKKENILSAIEQGAFSPALNDRLNELDNDITNLSVSIEAESNKGQIYAKSDIINALMRYKSLDITDRSQAQRLIDIFLGAAALYDDKLIAICNFNSDKSILTVPDITQLADLFCRDGELCSDYSVMVGHQGLEPRTDRL